MPVVNLAGKPFSPEAGRRRIALSQRFGTMEYWGVRQPTGAAFPMTFPVLVEPCEGQFAAVLVGAPQVRVVGSTREGAITALKMEIARRVGRGELLSLEVAGAGVTELAGKYADDATLREICAEAYRQRDAEIPE